VSLSEEWRLLGNQIPRGLNAWLDASLAAFAAHASATIVTLSHAADHRDQSEPGKPLLVAEG